MKTFVITIIVFFVAILGMALFGKSRGTPEKDYRFETSIKARENLDSLRDYYQSRFDYWAAQKNMDSILVYYGKMGAVSDARKMVVKILD